MDIDDEREKQIIEAGAKAYHRGANPSFSNPYVRGTPDHELWFRGWAREADEDPRQKL